MLVFAEVWIQRILSNAFVCILLAAEVRILFLSRSFRQPRTILFDDVVGYDANMNSSMQRDSIETIVSKRLRSRNETCTKLFLTIGFSLSVSFFVSSDIQF